MRRQAERSPARALPAFLGRGHRLGRRRRNIASGLAFFLSARRRGRSRRRCCGRFFLAHIMLLVVDEMLRRRGYCVQLYANCGKPQANWRLRLLRPCADQAAAWNASWKLISLCGISRSKESALISNSAKAVLISAAMAVMPTLVWCPMMIVFGVIAVADA